MPKTRIIEIETFKACKPHKCAHCKKIIPAGTLYTYMTLCVDHKLTHSFFHNECVGQTAGG